MQPLPYSRAVPAGHSLQAAAGRSDLQTTEVTWRVASPRGDRVGTGDRLRRSRPDSEAWCAGPEVRRGLPGRRGRGSSSVSPWRSRSGECIAAGLEGWLCLQDTPGQVTRELPARSCRRGPRVRTASKRGLEGRLICRAQRWLAEKLPAQGQKSAWAQG